MLLLWLLLFIHHSLIPRVWTNSTSPMSTKCFFIFRDPRMHNTWYFTISQTKAWCGQSWLLCLCACPVFRKKSVGFPPESSVHDNGCKWPMLHLDDHLVVVPLLGRLLSCKQCLRFDGRYGERVKDRNVKNVLSPLCQNPRAEMSNLPSSSLLTERQYVGSICIWQLSPSPSCL